MPLFELSCIYRNFSGATAQKAFHSKHFRRIQSHPKQPSKITKLPLTHKTRNFGRSWEFRPPDSPWYSSTQKISKSNIFCRLSCFLSNEFLSKFPERKPDENRHGELSEWSKVQHSKSWCPLRDEGSNPSVSATEKACNHADYGLFLIPNAPAFRLQFSKIEKQVRVCEF